MGGFFVNFTKTFFIPAFIALALYISLTYVAIPLYRQHRQRYAQYLPLTEISERTSSIWKRIYEKAKEVILPSWRRMRATSSNGYGHQNLDVEDGGLFDDEDGEGLVGFDINESRRETLARRAHAPDLQRRLSRDLEEGFRDDSDDEVPAPQSSEAQR